MYLSKIKAVKPHHIKGGVTKKKWDIEGEICQWKVVEISKLLWDTCICIDVQCCNTILFNKGKKNSFWYYKAKTCNAYACTVLQYAKNKCACMDFKVSLLLEILKDDHVLTKCFITLHFTFIVAESHYVGEWLWYRDKSGTLPSFSGGNNWIHF